MSGSAASLPLAALGSNPTTTPLESLQQWNEAQKSGLQAQGLGLQNQQAALMLGLRGQLVGSLGLGPNGQPMAPGQMPPGGGMGGGGAGDPLAASGMPQVSPNAVMTPFGVPAPRGLMIGAVMSADPAKQMAEIYNMGRQRVTQLMTQAGDVNDPDPAKQAQAAASVRANAGQLYAEGWIDPRAYQTLMSDPSKSGAFIMGTASPDAHLSAYEHAGLRGMTWQNGKMVYDPNAAAGLATAGAQVAGAEAGAKVGPALQEAAGKRAIDLATTTDVVPVLSEDGRTVTPTTVTGAEKLRRAGGSVPGGGGNTAGVFTPGESTAGGSPFANYIQDKEGGAPGVKNGRSTATGPQQFTEGTWLDTLKTVAPDFAAGKTDDQLLALRNNKQWSDVVTDALATRNADAIKSMNIPHTVDPATGGVYNGVLGMAHFFGASGAAKVLEAPANTPMTALFPPGADGKPNPVIAANPQLANQTSTQVATRYADEFGLKPYGASGQQAGPQTPAAGGAVGIPGAPEPTAGSKAAMEINKQQIEKDATIVTDAQTGAMRAQAAVPVLLDLRSKAPNIASGAGGELRAAANNYLATFGPDWVQKFSAAVGGLDTSKVSDQQQFIKQAFNQVTNAESQLSGARVGAMLTQYFSKAMPNINMQGPAIKEMANFLLVGNQMVRDYGNEAATHYNGERSNFMADPVRGQYRPMTDFDQTWTAPGSVHSPQVYEAAARLLNGRGFKESMVGLTHDQVVETYKIVHRADPGARFTKNQLVPSEG